MARRPPIRGASPAGGGRPAMQDLSPSNTPRLGDASPSGAPRLDQAANTYKKLAYSAAQRNVAGNVPAKRGGGPGARSNGNGIGARFSPDWVEHVLETPAVLDFYVQLYMRSFTPSERREKDSLAWSDVREVTRLLASSLGIKLNDDSVASFFTRADRNKKGTLSEKEFKIFFVNVLRWYMDSEHCEREAAKLKSVEHDSHAELFANSDWLRLLLGNPGTRSEICRERFEKYDIDANGRLNWTEANRFFEVFCEDLLLPTLEGDEFMKFYSAADSDSKGSVTFDECERALAGLCRAALEYRNKPIGNDYKALTMQQRFPDVSLQLIKETVDECDGHAGHATKLLRRMGYHDRLAPPPIYGKHKIKFGNDDQVSHSLNF